MTRGRFAARSEGLEQRLLLSGVSVGDGQRFGTQDVIAALQVETYSQSSGGLLAIEIGGIVAGPGLDDPIEGYDQINVSGAAQLAGSLEVTLVDGFVPEVGDTFDILKFGSVSGSFDLASGLFALGDGTLFFEVVQHSDRLQLVARAMEQQDLDVDDRDPSVNDAFGMLLNTNYFGFDTFTITTSLSIGEFFQASGTVTLKSSNETVTLADGTSINADVVRIGGHNINAFAGVGGPYFVDSDDDGDIDGDDVPNEEATGLALHEVDFALALLSPSELLSGSTPLLSWAALNATASKAEFVGVEDVTLEGTNISVAMNLVRGFVSPSEAPSKVVDFSKQPLSVLTAPGKTMSIAHDGSKGELLQAVADINVEVGEFFSLEGRVGIERSAQTVALSDGSTIDADVIAFGGKDMSAFAGTNGGSAEQLGLVLEDVDFGLTIVRDRVDASRVFRALQADAGTADLVGIESVVATGTELSVGINLGASKDGPVADLKTTPIVLPDDIYTINLDGSKGRLNQVAGHLLVEVGDFVRLDGDFAVEQSQTTVTLTDGSTVAAQQLLIGANDVTAFAGINAGSDGAVGIDLQDVSFGLAIITDSKQQSRQWIAGRGDAESAEFVGIDPLTARAEELGVEVNLGAKDGSRIDYSTHPLTIRTGPDTSVVVDDADMQTRVTGHVELAVDQYVTVEGNVSVSFEEIVTENSGLIPTKTKTRRVVAGIGDADIFVGDPGSGVGLSITNALAGFVYQKVEGSTDPTVRPTGYAVQADGDVALVGIDGVTVSGRVGIAMNKTGAALNETIEFLSATGTETQSIQLVFPDSDPRILVTGKGVDIDLAGVAKLKGDIAITPTNPAMAAQGAVTGTKLLFAANNVEAFLGYDGKGLAMSGGEFGAIVISNGVQSLGSGSPGGIAIKGKGTVRTEGLDVTLIGDVDILVNTTGAAIDESVRQLDGTVIDVKFDAGNRLFKLFPNNFDVALDGIVADGLDSLGDLLSGLAADLQPEFDIDGVVINVNPLSIPLPGTNISVDSLIGFSKLIGVGDFIQHYLDPTFLPNLPAVVFGIDGPTLRGLIDYLNANWLPSLKGFNPVDFKGLDFTFDDQGFSLTFDAAPSFHQTADLNFGAGLDALGVSFDSNAAIDLNVQTDVSLDFGVNWIDGSTRFDINKLGLQATASVDDLLLSAKVGPLKVAIGDRNAQMGHVAAALGGSVSFVNGEFDFTPGTNSISADLPLYASLSGVTLGGVSPPRLLADLQFTGPNPDFSIVPVDFEKLLDFRNLGIAQLVQMFPDVRDFLSSIVNVDALSAKIPFVDVSLNQVLGFATAFDTDILQKLDFKRPRVDLLTGFTGSISANSKLFTSLGASFTSDLIGQDVSILAPDGALAATYRIAAVVSSTSLELEVPATSAVTDKLFVVHRPIEPIQTLQEFVVAINAAGILPPGFNVAFDPVTQVFSIPLGFSGELPQVNAPLDFGFDFGDALSLTTTGNGQINAGVEGSLAIYVDLDGQTDVAPSGSVTMGSNVLTVAADFFRADMLQREVTIGSTSYKLARIIDAQHAELDRVAVRDATNKEVTVKSGIEFGIADAKLAGNLGLAVNNMSVAAQLGFLGITAGGPQSGVSIDGSASLSLDRLPGSGIAADRRFSINELFSGDAFDALRFDFDGDATARLKGLKVDAGFGAELPIAPSAEIAIAVQNFLDLSKVQTIFSSPSLPFSLDVAKQFNNIIPGAVVLSLPDLGNAFDFAKVGIVDVIRGVQIGLDFLDAALINQPFYNLQLPIINRSLKDVFGFADDFAAKIEGLSVDPEAALAQAEALIEAALGLLDNNLLDFNDQIFGLRLNGNVIDVHLGLGAIFSDTFGFALDLGKLLPGVDSVGMLSDLLNADGSVTLEALAKLSIDVGIRADLAEPEIFLYDYRTERDITRDVPNSTFSSVAFPAGSSSLSEAQYSNIRSQMQNAINAALAGQPDGARVQKIRATVVSAINGANGANANTDSIYGAGQLAGRRQMAIIAVQDRLSRELGVEVTLLAGEQVVAANSTAMNQTRAFEDVRAVVAVPVGVEQATGTHLTIGTRIAGTGLNLGFAVGPISMSVNNGYAVLDGDGVAATRDFASFTVAVDQAPGTPHDDGKYHILSESLSENLQFSTSGRLDVNLPTQLNLGELSFDLSSPIRLQTPPELGSLGLSNLLTGLSGLPIPGNFPALNFTLPDIRAEFTRLGGSLSLVSLLNDPSQIFDGLDFALGSLEDIFDKVTGADLPFLGDNLQGAARFINGLRAGILNQLKVNVGSPDELIADIQLALFRAFGPNGLNILKDVSLDGLFNLDDIPVQWRDLNGNVIGNWIRNAQLPDGALDSIQFGLQLGGKILNTGIDLPLDLDLPGFQFDIDGGFGLEMDWKFDFGFGISVNDGFYVTTKADENDPEFQFSVAAYLDGSPNTPGVTTAFVGTGHLAFFDATIRDNGRANGKPSGLDGLLSLNLKGNAAQRLTFNELQSQPLETTFNPNFAVDAGLNLAISLETPAASMLPKLKADLVADFDWVLKNGPQVPQIDLQNLRVGVGSIVADFLRPIAQRIQGVLDPLRPIIDGLTQTIPGLDRFLPDATVMGLINLIMKAQNKPAINWDFVWAGKEMLRLVDLVAGMQADGEILLGSLSGLGLPNPRAIAAAFDLNSLPANFRNGLLDIQQKSVGRSPIGSTERSGFKTIEYLRDINNWLKILQGGDATLFTYEMPLLGFSTGFDVPIAEVGVDRLKFGVGAKGNFNAAVDLAFGYDTFGARAALSSKNPLDLLDGFYVADFSLPQFRNFEVVAGTGGVEKDEAKFDLSIGLNAGVSLLLVRGGLSGNVNFKFGADLQDIAKSRLIKDADGNVLGATYISDGKVRGSEVDTMFNYQNGGFKNLFNLAGEAKARANAYVDVYYVAGWGNVFNGTLFDKQLFKVEHKAPQVSPTLATKVGTTLYVHAGPKAGDRQYFNIKDGNEKFIVNGSGGTVNLEFDDWYQTYSGITHIVADMGNGNDVFDASRLSGVTVDVKGGAGKDRLFTGSAGGTLDGGAGKDVLTGKAGRDVLKGGDGNDRITAGDGNDNIDAGAGDDRIVAGAGDDTVSAGDGADRITGDAGNDSIDAGAGEDRVTAGDGDDTVIAGSGNDIVSGDLGNDAIGGGDGDDRITGNDGNDIIAGGSGVDRIEGQNGNDLIDGGDGNDALDGDAGDDTINGSGGADLINADAGNDIADGGADDDRLNGSDGDDMLGGGSGADWIEAGRGNDIVSGDAGNDLLVAGVGNDSLDGGADEDRLLTGDGDDTARGGDGADYVSGTKGNDFLSGDGGNDIIEGDTGNDWIDGGDGDDDLSDSAGNDTLGGGRGNDAVNGAQGDDVYFFVNNWGDDLLSDFNGFTTFDFSAVATPTTSTINPAHNEVVSSSGDRARLSNSPVVSLVLGSGNDALFLSDHLNREFNVRDVGGNDTYELTLGQPTAARRVVINDTFGGNALRIEQVAGTAPLGVSSQLLTNGKETVSFSNTFRTLDVFGNGARFVGSAVDALGGSLIIAAVPGATQINVPFAVRATGSSIDLRAPLSAPSITLESFATLEVDQRLNAKQNGYIDARVYGDGSNILLNEHFTVSAGNDSNGGGAGWVRLTAPDGSIVPRSGTSIVGTGSTLMLNAAGSAGTQEEPFLTQVARLHAVTAFGGAGSVVLDEADDLELTQQGHFNPENNNGLVLDPNFEWLATANWDNSLSDDWREELVDGSERFAVATGNGSIDIALFGAGSVLTLTDGEVVARRQGDDIALTADDFDFVSGENRINGSGDLSIRAATDGQSYHIGSAAEDSAGGEFTPLRRDEFTDLGVRDFAAIGDNFEHVAIGHRSAANTMLIGDVADAPTLKFTSTPRSDAAALRNSTTFFANTITVAGDVQAPVDRVAFNAFRADIQRRNLHLPLGAPDSQVSGREVAFNFNEQLLVTGAINGSQLVDIDVTNSSGNGGFYTPAGRAVSVRVDVGASITGTHAGSLVDIDSNAEIEIAGVLEVRGANSKLDAYSGSKLTVVAAGLVVGRDTNDVLSLSAGELVSIMPGSAVTAGARFIDVGGKPVAVKTADGAGVIINSPHELLIGGSVTSSDGMTLGAGTPRFNHRDYFQSIARADADHPLLTQTQYAFLLTGTLTTLADDSLLALDSASDVIIRGNINVLGANSDLRLQSDRFVYVEGFLDVRDDIRILGAATTDGRLLNRSNPRLGSSVYVHATAIVVSRDAGSSIDIRGGQDVDLFGTVVSGGTITASGVDFTGPSSTISVTAGQQVFVDTGLLASGTIEINGGIAGVTAEEAALLATPATEHLGVYISTAGGATTRGLTTDGSGGGITITSKSDIELLGNITAGADVRQSFDSNGKFLGESFTYSTEPARITIDTDGQAFIGGHTLNKAGELVTTGTYLRAAHAIDINGDKHTSGKALLVHAASELSVNDPNGAITLSSGQEAEILGMFVAGGRIDAHYDPQGNYLGRVPVYFDGDSTITLKAAGQLVIGQDVVAGKAINVIGGSGVAGDTTGLIIQGSGRLLTNRPNSAINFTAPGTINVLPPGHINEIEASGFMPTSNGVLTQNVTLAIEVDRVDFTYRGTATLTAAATADNKGIADLRADIQRALSNGNYTVTRSNNAQHPVGSTFTELADDPSSPGLVDPDITVKLKNGKFVFASPYRLQVLDSSLNAHLLGLYFPTSALHSIRVYAIDAPEAGSVINFGDPQSASGKAIIGGKVRAHSAINVPGLGLNVPAGLDLGVTGVLETINGSINLYLGADGLIKGELIAGGNGSDIKLTADDSLTIRGHNCCAMSL